MSQLHLFLPIPARSSAGLAIIQFLKVMYLILTLQVPLTLPSVFSKTDSVFLKEGTQKCVLNNTCPRACISQYTPECDEYLFLTEYEYRILSGFQKSPNTEYRILFGIEKIQIPNTEYYSVSWKSEYRIRIVLFGVTIRIPNTKYRIIHEIVEKIKLK